MDTNSSRRSAPRIFQRKIILRLYGPVMETNIWRTKYNEEINTLPKGDDIVRFIKPWRLRWLGHVERVEDNAMPNGMVKGNLYSNRR
jgi:hypothetical protein